MNSTKTSDNIFLTRTVDLPQCFKCWCKMGTKIRKVMKIQHLRWSAIEFSNKIWEIRLSSRSLFENCSKTRRILKWRNKKMFQRKRSIKHGKNYRLECLRRVWVRFTRVWSCFKSAWWQSHRPIDKFSRLLSQVCKITWVTSWISCKRTLNNNNRKTLIKNDLKLLILWMKSFWSCCLKDF